MNCLLNACSPLLDIEAVFVLPIVQAGCVRHALRGTVDLDQDSRLADQSLLWNLKNVSHSHISLIKNTVTFDPCQADIIVHLQV